MISTEYDSTEDKRVLTAMVVDDLVCGRISEKWEVGGLFRTRWANIIGGWCVKYFRKYNKAPRSDIEGLFTAWASGANDKSTVDLVDQFLADLSGEYEEEGEEINPDYMIDVAGEYFNAVRLESMMETIKGHIQNGNTTKALEAVTKWGKVEMGAGAGINVLQDKNAIQAAFESETEALIKYPGDLGKFFGNQLARDEFVALTGATGRGKTWWLIDFAWMGMRQGRRVAFFEVGDMSQNQIMRRFMCRAAGHPIKPPYDVEVPIEITNDPNAAHAEVETETKSFKGPLDWPTAWEACEKRNRRHKKPLLRMSVHPNSSINVDGISSILKVWEREDWIPDVIVIDYADILASPAGYPPGEREGINATWKALRSLSQTRHCLVITATQGDANSYSADTIRRINFSDDRRKNDHVTGMLGLNSSEEEQKRGIFRLNWTKRREDAYHESFCVHVAGCLSIGRPHIKSTF